MELAKQYSPKDVEERIYGLWIEKGAFRAEGERGGSPYSISIPPPNVTAILHLGHALNNVIQDILIRWKRLEGRNALWMPGTDHAGIATQNVVEKKLAVDGRTRQDLGREKFLKEVWGWREEYGGRIIEQLKALGCSCDWDRIRFTMDGGYSRAVIEVFTRLYDKGLIYRGNYIINWCPRCQTALSDEEAEHDELKGALYYIRYPVAGEAGHITVATTRPETMLGDVAVAVNPNDPRHRGLVGKELILHGDHIEFIIIRVKAIISFYPVFISLFTHIEDTPVITIDKYLTGLIPQKINIHPVIDNVLHHSIPHDGIFPVITTVSEIKPLKTVSRFPVKELMIKVTIAIFIFAI